MILVGYVPVSGYWYSISSWQVFWTETSLLAVSYLYFSVKLHIPKILLSYLVTNDVKFEMNAVKMKIACQRQWLSQFSGDWPIYQ